MRLLVTGADGFIGTHLAQGLSRVGHEVFGAVFSRPARRREVRIDLTQSAELLALPSDIDVVVNAAGVVDPKIGAPSMFAVNLEGTRHLLAWAKARGVGHFVQLSSVAVYGPLVVGENRSEDTLRLGRALGLPYMRSKALAECAIEQSRVPYTLLRPPAVLGVGDTVVTRGFMEALAGPGLPLVPGARERRKVSLALATGLVSLVARVIEHGPLRTALHAVDAELTLAELGALYARALAVECRFSPVPWSEVVRRRGDAGFSWLVASARFGQHYSRERLRAHLGEPVAPDLEQAIRAAVSGLQGNRAGLS